MKKVIAYLIMFLGGLVAVLVAVLTGAIIFPEGMHLPLQCVLIGGVGGIVYCLRGVYLNASVKGNWAPQWEPWYYIRPLISMICGGVSWLFLSAGLVVLESTTKPEATDIGFLALSFIAGLNVDKFVAKIEDIAQAAWGIEKSRTARASSVQDER